MDLVLDAGGVPFVADLFASFDRIRIINLPHRTDRRAEMREEFRRVGLGDDCRIEFVEGLEPKDSGNWRQRGERGVFMSHLGILRDAEKAGESVLIFEDDVDFTEALWADKPVTADVYYGGYEASDPANLSQSDIIGAHCMGFSSAIVARLVPYLTSLIDHPSPPPIDGAYVWFRRANPDVTSFFAEPPIAVQRPSRSDITPSRWDRQVALRPILSWVRRLRRRRGISNLSFGLPESIALSLLGCGAAVYVAWRHI